MAEPLRQAARLPPCLGGWQSRPCPPHGAPSWRLGGGGARRRARQGGPGDGRAGLAPCMARRLGGPARLAVGRRLPMHAAARPVLPRHGRRAQPDEGACGRLSPCAIESALRTGPRYTSLGQSGPPSRSTAARMLRTGPRYTSLGSLRGLAMPCHGRQSCRRLRDCCVAPGRRPPCRPLALTIACPLLAPLLRLAHTWRPGACDLNRI